jgi:hypothetical protein
LAEVHRSRDGSSVTLPFFAALNFAVSALYSSAIMAFYRAVIFPRFEPGTTDGILPGDPWMFHTTAVRVAENMSRDGWSAWTLRPDGSGNVGVVAVLYYLFGPVTSLAVVLNAFLHGIACAALILFGAQYLSRRHAVLVALPFILSPYQMEWYSQPTKDSFAAAGFLLMIYGWCILIRSWPEARSKLRFALGLVIVASGIALISIVRPYLVQVLVAMSAPCVLFVSWTLLRRARMTDAIIGVVLIRGAALVLVLVSLLPMARVTGTNAVTWHADRAAQTLVTSVAEPAPGWQRTAWLPAKLDFTLYGIAAIQRNLFRDLATDKNINSREALIDIDVHFHSAADVLAYIPRAVQIGLLAPFPNQWSFFGIPSRSVFRNFATLQTILVYSSLMALMLGMRSFRRRIEFYAAFWYSFGVIAVYALATPHVGVLDRYRYPFLMLLVTMGLTTCVTSLRSSRQALERRALFD